MLCDDLIATSNTFYNSFAKEINSKKNMVRTCAANSWDVFQLQFDFRN